MDVPKISVVIPTFNRSTYLKEAIASVLAQTMPVYEIIVVDDGSTDNTRQVVESLSGPIRYICQSNSGPAAARNRGMRETRGDWIAFQDSDDLWVANKIAMQVAFIVQNPEMDFLFGHMSNFCGTEPGGAPEILNRQVNAYLTKHATNLRDLFLWLLVENPIPTPTAMLRRACLEQIGFFDEALRCCEDYEYWLRVAYHCRTGFVDRILLLRRMHGDNLINDYTARYEQHLRVLESLPQRHAHLSAAMTVAWRRALAKTQYRLGAWNFKKRNYSQACQFFGRVQWRDLWPDMRSLLLFPPKAWLARKFEK